MTGRSVDVVVLGVFVLVGSAGCVQDPGVQEPAVQPQEYGAPEPAGESSGLTALDYMQIETLYARSNLGMDSAAEKGALFARTFTPDGELLRERDSTAGHGALAQLTTAHERGLHSWTSNLMVEPWNGGAVGWGYLSEFEIGGSDGGRGGLYHDVLVKTKTGWRFKKRTYVPRHGLPELKQSMLMPIEAVRARPPQTRQDPLTALDYAEIKRVVGQYNLGYDSTRDSDAGALMGAAFSADAVFEQGDTSRTGRAAIVERYTATGLSTHHWVSNLWIAPTPEGARSWCYVLLFGFAGDDNDDNTVVWRGAGVLRERYVRTPEGWQISFRRYDALSAPAEIVWPSLQDPFVDVLTPDPVSDDTVPPSLTARDHIEIEQLYVRSNIAFDGALDEGRAFATTFVPDGALATPAQTVTGHDDLARIAAQNTPGLHTWMSNLIVEPSSHGATGYVYTLSADTTGALDRPGTRSPMSGGGLYRDELVRTPDGWRFKTRTLAPSTADLAEAWTELQE